MILLGTICFFAGVAFGWVFWRNERTYQDGWRDCERFLRHEAKRAALRKASSPLLNPVTGDWYDK